MKTQVARIFILLLSIAFVYPVFMGEVILLSSFNDDFFYYLKVADNFLDGKGLSFAEGYPTNGFQPLYQLLVIGFSWISNILHMDLLIFIRLFLAAIFCLLSFYTYRQIKPVGLLSSLLFLGGISSFFVLSIGGMEVILLVPLLVVFCARCLRLSLSPFQLAAWIVLLFFIRIDSLVISAPIALVYCRALFKNGRISFRQFIIPSIAGALPIALYCLYNYFQYGMFFPVSGLAKSAESFNFIHWPTFRSVLFADPGFRVLVYAPIVICIALMITRRFKTSLLIFSLLIILFYLVQNSIRSDWPLWPWYFYPFSTLFFFLSLITSGTLFEQWEQPTKFLLKSIVAGSVLLVFLSAAFFTSFFILPVKIPSTLTENGFRIRNFEKSHRGIYAMGDRAGVVGYLIESPLIQLEGLVMDKPFLNKLRATKKLRELLNAYQVDYYVANNPTKLSDGKYVVIEPIQLANTPSAIVDTLNWPVLIEFDIERSRRINKKEVISYKTVIFQVPQGFEVKSATNF